ncbi:MAG: hypothetical protein KAJ95_07580, partial [Gammaproteobacteria bacterium]|nr:hypothetical protein [Gammaproteobacteria bacterium]
MKKSTKIFLSITLLVAISDALFVTLNYYSSRDVLVDTLQDQGKAMEQAFELMLTSTEANMVQNAMLIATDPVVRQLFLRGKNAVSREGGGAGGKQAAAIRTELLDYVKPRWEPLTKRFAVRQLHFHLGPGSQSFLRVHKPDKFGDRMDDIRHTVVDSNHYLIPTSGFEI